MILAISVVVALIFAAGCWLLLQRDLLRMSAGVLLASHATNLFLMASGLLRGEAPVGSALRPEEVSDPLVQALTLTAVVISFAIAALLMGLLLRVQRTHRGIAVGALSSDEGREPEPEEPAALPDAGPW